MERSGKKKIFAERVRNVALKNAFKEGFIASVKFYDIRVTGHLADDSVYESTYLQYQKSLTEK